MLTPQRRIALLLDTLDSDYQTEVIEGVLRATRASNVNTLIIPGGLVPKPGTRTSRGFLFDFVARSKVDGLLLLSGSLSNQCGSASFRRWFEQFAPIPSVNIGLVFDDVPSVGCDNETGMYQVVSHLIQVHGKRRIACVRGPRESSEAQDRFSAYVRALKDNDLPLDPALVVPGETFSREDGYEAVHELFDERGLDIRRLDALVCVNDDTALGAIEALTLRGIHLPEELAVTGFDDTPNSSTSNPALTTVNQRVEEQGYTAARELVEALQQGVTPRSVTLRSNPVFRGSCGCRPAMRNDSAGSGAAPKKVRSMQLELLGRRERWLAELARAGAGRLGKQTGWEEKVLLAIQEELCDQPGALLFALEALARRAVAVGGNVDAVQDVLTTVRLLALPLVADLHEQRARLEDVLQETRHRLTSVALAAMKESERAINRHLRQLLRASLGCLVGGSPETIASALRSHLPPLGIAACTLSLARLLPDRNEPQFQVLARLNLDMKDKEGSLLSAMSLGLDQTLEHRAAVVMMPLDFDESPVGLAGFEWGARNPALYEQLREFFCVCARAWGGGGAALAPLRLGP